MNDWEFSGTPVVRKVSWPELPAPELDGETLKAISVAMQKIIEQMILGSAVPAYLFDKQVVVVPKDKVLIVGSSENWVSAKAVKQMPDGSFHVWTTRDTEVDFPPDTPSYLVEKPKFEPPEFIFEPPKLPESDLIWPRYSWRLRK